MEKNEESYMLGELLCFFGVVHEKDVKRGLVLAKHTGLPLGKCLVMLDVVTPEVIRASVEAQSMLKDGLIDREGAKEAMGVVYRKKWTLTDALIVLGVDAYATRGTRLGELLHSAEHLNSEQLEIALRAGDSSGLPLGRVLLLLDRLSIASLNMALELQKEVRWSKLERADAIDKLKNIRGQKARDFNGAADPDKIRIGELLVAASLLKSVEVDSAVQIAQANDKMLGEVLIEMGWISEDLLSATLRLQEMVWSGGVSANRAANVLDKISSSGQSADDGLKEAGLATSQLQKELSFCDFLRFSGYLGRDSMKVIIRDIMSAPEMVALVMKHARKSGEMSSDYLREAIKIGFRDTQLLSDMLHHVRSKDADLLDSALVMHELLRAGKLTLDQALINFTIRRDGIKLN